MESSQTTKPNSGQHKRVYEQINNAAAPLMRIHPEGDILWMNDSAEQLLGITSDDEYNFAKLVADPVFFSQLLNTVRVEGRARGKTAFIRCGDDTIKRVIVCADMLVEDYREKYLRCYLTDISFLPG